MAEDEPKRSSTGKYSRKSNHPDGYCGCGPIWSPSWLQWMRHPLIIVGFIWAVGVVTYVNNSYFGAILTTIERRFGLSSSQSAFLGSLNDLSSTLVVVFISFIADRTSRPMWLFVSLLFMALGNIMTAVPHFLSDPLNTEALLSGRRTTSSSNTSFTSNLCVIGGESPGDDLDSNSTDSGTCMGESVGFRGLIWWAIVGQIVLGIGQAVFTPVVVPYLDDLAGRNRPTFVLYYSFYITVWVGGPALGFLLGSSCLQYYVDFERIPGEEIPSGISQWDPRWIGAWWIGFVAAACFLLLGAIPMPLLPRDPSVNVCVSHHKDQNDNGKTVEISATSEINEKQQSDVEPQGSLLTTSKGFLPVIKRILKQPVLVFYMFFMVIELACIGVFQSFTIKYFQYQFGVAPKRAAFLNGAVLVPAALLGINVSAYICRHFKLTLKQCGQYVFCKNIITIAFLVIALFIGCKNPEVAGVNKPYSTMPSSLDVACNTDCGCQENIFRPVCGSDGISYLSPCHAGCQTLENSSYTDCTCMNPSTTSEGEEFINAKSGLCEREERCENNFIYLVVMFGFLAFVNFQDNAPMNLIVLGHSDNDIRTTVYGLSSFVYHILGFFPAPIYFGAIVNSTCSLWQYTCGERAACWLYNIDELRYAYFGLNIALRMCQIVICIGVLLTVKNTVKKKTGSGDIETKQEIE